MNHPTRADLISYLYREVSTERRALLANHLRDCPPCAAQLNAWKTTAKGLDALPLPRQAEPAGKRPQIGLARPAIQWAAAALILAGIAFGAGRPNSRIAAYKTMRAALDPVLRELLRH